MSRNLGTRKARVCGPFAQQGRQDSNLQPPVLEVGPVGQPMSGAHGYAVSDTSPVQHISP